MSRFNFDDLSNAERAELARELLASVDPAELTPDERIMYDRLVHLLEVA